MENVTKVQFADSLVWKVLDLCVSRGFSVIMSIVLARNLGPECYGLMSVWTIILALGNVFVTGGMDTVLVQKKDLSEMDWNYAFSCSFARSVLLMAVLFLLSPVLASFYESVLLENLLKAAGIDFVSQSVITVYVAKAMRKMSFKSIFAADFFSVILGGAAAIGSMKAGWQPWTLLIHVLFQRGFYAIFLMAAASKRVKLIWDIDAMFILARDGFKAMVNGIFDLTTSAAVNLFTAKKWQPSDVGYANRADKISQTFGVEIYNIISGLLLPTFSSYQNDKKKLMDITRLLVKCSCYIMFPIMFGLAACSRELVILLLTDKWLPAVPILKTACIYYAWNPIRQLCMNLNYSVSHYKKNMNIELGRMLLTFLAVGFLAVLKDAEILYMNIAVSLIAVLAAFAYLCSLKDAINYGLGEILKDIGPILLLAGAAAVPAYFFSYIHLKGIPFLACSAVAGAGFYVMLSAVFRLDIFYYVMNVVRRMLIKNENSSAH